MYSSGVYQGDIGAFCPHSDVYISGHDHGLLSGLRFAVKDIFDIEGHVTGCGNPDWLRTHGPAEATAPAVLQLVEAGAVMVGKTLTEELAFSLVGENAHYGTPLNCRAPDRVPGGSSSGSASAVAGDLAHFALGSDTGGSVRIPASFCGVFGFRPSHGRISLDGVMPLAPSFDTVGWFARDSLTLQRVGEVLLKGGRASPFASHPAGSKPGPLLIAEDAFDVADEAVSKALSMSVGDVVAAGGKGAEEIVVAADGLGAWAELFRILQGGEIWQVHKAWIEKENPTFGPGVRERFEMVSRITRAEIEEADEARRRITRDLHDLLSENAVLILPTAPCIAPLKNSPAGVLESFRSRTLSLTAIAGMARLPQVTLPVVSVEGAPVGLSFIAGPGRDEMLLAYAREVSARLI